MRAESIDILRCPCCGRDAAPFGSIVIVADTSNEVLEGVLICAGCERWFRIQEGIADLVRDGLRDVDADRDFLARHEDVIPPRQLERWRSLLDALPPRSMTDQAIFDEGVHWGRFMRHFWDAGDRSIFDIRIKGTHPSYFVAGILEPDERDRYRKWSNYPRAVGDAIFPWLGELAGKRGVDVGCGGGQFGLEAARRGLEMIGFDPSFEEIRLARIHAREQGIRNIDYVRAEPAHPPFAANVFDLFMAKDALHHVPNLAEAFSALILTLTADAVLVIHEHVGKPSRKNRLFGSLMPRLIRKIRARYAHVEIPPELLRDSANEDVSASAIEPTVRVQFDEIASVDSLFLADDLQMAVHYAYGKRRWFERIIYMAAVPIEKLFLLLGDRQHWTFVGKHRGGSGT